MNVLTDEEIDAVTDKQWDGIRGREIAAAHRAYARAIEAEVIRKLAAGVSVEPAYTVESCTLSRSRDCCRSIQCKRKIDVFTLDQLTTAIAAARVQALEEAVKVCEGASSYLEHQQHLLASRDCANAIRALIGGAT